MSGCAIASGPAPWRSWDLGAFHLQTPDSLKHQAAGTDSQAGTFSDAAVRVQYDFGRYSDPLTLTDATLQYRSHAGSVDGVPARFVQFRLKAQSGSTQNCAGVHVPQVRPAGARWLSLTVLACADTSWQLADVPAILASIRFQNSVAQ